MKRLAVYIVCGMFVLSLSGPVSAVDKKKKQSVKQQEVQKKTPDSAKPGSTLKPARGTPVPKKKYDDFIDTNKNGIDDRQEKLKQKRPAATKKKEDNPKK